MLIHPFAQARKKCLSDLVLDSSDMMVMILFKYCFLMGAVNRYRPEIDGLRAFAVVSVIINHLNKDILPGGYLGVDIFFVISGYVITSSLSGRSSAGFKDFIG